MNPAPDNPANDFATRVLVLAPTRRDAEVTRELITKTGVPVFICENLSILIREIANGAGGILVTEDIFRAVHIDNFFAALAAQPPWSDIAVLLLLQGGNDTAITSEALAALRNVTLLERPTSMRSLASAVQVAVRGRLRQYQIRDQILEIQRNQREREMLLDSERAARTESERANRVKDDFLATVSHELRTPLNAILGWSQILVRSPEDPAEVLAGMEIIDRNARIQAQLIEDLLDTSRIITGKIRLDMQVIDIAAAVKSAVASVQPTAELKKVRIEKVIGTTGTILADPGRIQQILWNLLSNAVKFTPDGGKIFVTVRRVDKTVEIEVIDSGQGLLPEFIPHVFERFRQADSSTTRNHGGLGLGLAIVKHLVELHGGNVTAYSAGKNCGATFTLAFPLTTSAPAVRNAPAVPLIAHARFNKMDLSGLKILVVDDDDDGRRLTKRLLTECKAEVTVAASAKEALSLLPSIDPHVLVSDIGMPEMDGYQFIQRVRGISPSTALLPAVAVTAFARPEDRARALAAGYQDHLAKPIVPAELVALVARLAGKSANLSHAQ